MALIGKYIASNGVTVRIFDDDMAKTPEEQAAVDARIDAAMALVLRNMVAQYGAEGAMQRIEEKRREREERRRKCGKPPLTPVELTAEERALYGRLSQSVGE